MAKHDAYIHQCHIINKKLSSNNWYSWYYRDRIVQPRCKETVWWDPVWVQQAGQACEERHRPRHSQGQAQALPADRCGKTTDVITILQSKFWSIIKSKSQFDTRELCIMWLLNNFATSSLTGCNAFLFIIAGKCWLLIKVKFIILQHVSHHSTFSFDP